MIAKQLTTPKLGMDVSEWQGIIDWDKAAGHIDFAIVRLGFGQNTLDRQAKRNISECNRLGIPYGVYWFSYAWDARRANAEGEACRKYLEELEAKPQYPVYFDWEYDSRRYARDKGYEIDRQLLGQMAEAFCSRISEAGWIPGVYANPDYRRNAFPQEVLARYDLWLVDLSGTGEGVPMHQYRFDGSIPGVTGAVDLNRCHVDYPGAEALGRFIRMVQQAIGAKVDGIPGPETMGKLPMVSARYHPTHPVVSILQLRLAELGYPEVGRADGIAGAKFTAGVTNLQKKAGLTADGIVGGNTWAYLLGR